MMRLRLFLPLAALLALAAAMLGTWPVAAALNTRLIGHPFGDTYEYVRHIHALGQALIAGTDPFFDRMLLFPDGLEAAWLWSLPLQSFPQVFLQFVMPLAAAHNLTALGILALNGTVMAGFLRWLLRREPRLAGGGLAIDAAALIAGVAFTVAPPVMGQLGIGHTGVITLYPVVGFIWAALRLIHDPPASCARLIARILLTGLLLAASLWGSLTLLVYVTGPLAVFALVRAIRAGAVPRFAAACAAGAALALPFALPALSAASRAGAGFANEGAVTFSADLLAVVSPSFNNPLYANFSYNRSVLGVDPFEGAAYLGILPILLAIFALLRLRQARLWAVLAAAVWVLSLGPLLKVLGQVVPVTLDGYPGYISLPYALLARLPILSDARTPARFNLAIAIALAVLLAYGAALLLAWLRGRSRLMLAPAAALMLLGIVLDTRWFAGFPTIPADVPNAIVALSDRDERARAVFNMPWDHPLVDKDGMFLQIAHDLPMIAGHIARQTPLDPAKGMLLQETLDAALLHEAGADVLILHREWGDETGALEGRLRDRFGAPYYEDDALLVFRVPAYDGPAAGFTTLDRIPARLTDTGSLYFYAPAPGGALFSADVRAVPSPGVLVVSLDGQPIGSFPITGAAQVTLWVPHDAGYHTLSVAPQTPCPAAPFPGLACAALEMTNVSFAPPEAAP